MKELLQTETAIYQDIETVWQRVSVLEEYGHLWLPHTSAVSKKTPGVTGEQSLFGLSHFGSESLCRIMDFRHPHLLSLEIATKRARVYVTLILIEDGNAVQLTAVVSAELTGLSRLLPPLSYWYIRRVFRGLTQRIRKIACQPY